MKKKKSDNFNPVAKNAHLFNKSDVFTDKKKQLNKGYKKHKGKYNDF